MMRHCQFCGSEFPENARFCGHCGRIPASNTTLDTAFSPLATIPSASRPPGLSTPIPEGVQPVEEDEEDEEGRRRRALLLLAFPSLAEASSPTGGQAPQVQGMPGISGAPTVQGTPSESFGSVSSAASGQAASPPVQPRIFKQQAFAPKHPHVSHPDASTGSQHQKSPEHEHQTKQHEPRHHKHRESPRRHTSTSKTALGATTKWVLLVIISLLTVVAVILTSILVFASHSPLLGQGRTPSASPGKQTTISSTQAASPTACTSSSGVPCTGTVSPISPGASAQATGTFSFAGAIAGPLVITSLPICGMQGTTYVMQVIGAVGGTQYKFLLGILSYKGPGTYTSNLTVNLIKTPVVVTAPNELGNDGRLPVSISITNDGKTGMISSDLVGILNATQTQPSTGHVSGSWTCTQVINR